MKKSLTCGLCGTIKYNNGKKLICKPCNQKRASEWAKQNRERVNKKNRAWKENNKERALYNSRKSKVKQVYGLNQVEYEEMLERHNHRCAICGQKETISLKGTVWNLSIDHCHITGKIRGILCAQCNVGLSKFRENLEYFQNAITYLIKNK